MAKLNEGLEDVGQLRELDPDVEQKDIAVAMMFVFPRFSNGLIQKSSEHRMVEHNGERCLAIAVKLNVPLSNFQLDFLRGKCPEVIPGYPDWSFQQQDGLLYVGIPMNLISSVDEGIEEQSMAEFGNYDADFPEIVSDKDAEAIVKALIDDFGKTTVTIDLSVFRDGDYSRE